MSYTIQLSAEEQAFVDCLRKLAEVYETDEASTDDQRVSLSLLIKTFCPSSDPDFDNALSEVLDDGLTLQEVREGLAEDAGIFDYAQLYFFATIDVRLASGELQTVDTTGLSDEEFLALFSDG